MTHSNDGHRRPTLRPRLGRLAASLVAATIVAAGAGAGDAAATTCAVADATPAYANPQTIARATLCAVNAERRSHGLAPLRFNARLATAARHHSQDMVRRHYFSHVSLGGAKLASRVRQTGYMRSVSAWHVGETLAWGLGKLGSPGAVVRSWMGSPQHRAIILTPSFREVGIGVARGVPAAAQAPGCTYTADFGVRG
jgi:uncharacterized protein YkwD